MTDASHMKEARRAPGSEWFKNHPHLLEIVYDASKAFLTRVYPLTKRIAPTLSERVLTWSERVIKGWVFNCQMCGQCILHSTGMTCPMNCPKNIRNGPCGGVRTNGHCEVIPDMPCVWVQAWERSQQMQQYANELQIVQPPVDRSLQDTSAWINMIEDRDTEIATYWDDAANMTTAKASE